ncbi:MAG: DUF2336 domain-containing protein [Pseudomonadota bacterium]
MDNSASTLSQSDVEKLLHDPSPTQRVETTIKIAHQYQITSGAMGPKERAQAEDIFRILAKDAELRVREALAAHLKTTADLPHDVALTLAHDVDSVALPILKFSEVLSDADLIELLRGGCETRQVAIAQRPSLSGTVAHAVIDTGNENAVAHLVANEGADLDSDHFNRVLDQFQDSPSVADSLSRRNNLPTAISEKIVSALSQKMKSYLVDNHDLSQDDASNLVLQVRERATVSLLNSASNIEELEDLVLRLEANGRLTPSLVMRAICVGDLAFFECAMARLARIPLKNARLLIHDSGPLGLNSLCQRAEIPQRFVAALRAAAHLADETDYDGQAHDRERFMQRMIERLLTQFEDPASKMTEEDIDYLMSKLRQLAA